MPATDISICSRALVTLGARPISSFLATEGDSAVLCASIYPGLKDGIMASFPWRGLMFKKELTREATAPIGEWDYSYLLPGDMLSMPHAVFRETAETVPEHDFEIFNQKLYTRFERILVDYTASGVSESVWPAYFVDLMVTCVCAEIAFAVTDQQSVADNWTARAYGSPSQNKRGGAMAAAMAISSQGSGNIGFNNTAFIDARAGGWSG